MASKPEESGPLMMTIGEMRGQLRELIHAMNNTAQKVNDLWDRVAPMQSIADGVKRNSDSIADHEGRISRLEAAENRRDGAMGLGGWLLKAAPAITAFLAGAGIMEVLK